MCIRDSRESRTPPATSAVNTSTRTACAALGPASVCDRYFVGSTLRQFQSWARRSSTRDSAATLRDDGLMEDGEHRDPMYSARRRRLSLDKYCDHLAERRAKLQKRSCCDGTGASLLQPHYLSQPNEPSCTCSHEPEPPSPHGGQTGAVPIGPATMRQRWCSFTTEPMHITVAQP